LRQFQHPVARKDYDFGTATYKNRSFAAPESKVRWRKAAISGYKTTNFGTGSIIFQYISQPF
jgi:hypothetical protein